MHLIWNLFTSLYHLPSQLYFPVNLLVFKVNLTESLPSYQNSLRKLLFQFLVHLLLVQPYLPQLLASQLLFFYIHHGTKLHFFQQYLSYFETVFGVDSLHRIIGSKKSILLNEVLMVLLHVLVKRTVAKVLVRTNALITHRLMICISHAVTLPHPLPRPQSSQRQWCRFTTILVDFKSRTLLSLRHLEWVSCAG